MTQQTGSHRGGSYWMHTAYQKRATIIHPTMGPWAQRMLGKAHETLPSSVVIGGGGNHPGAGFFGPGMAPLPIGDPDRGVQNAELYTGVDEKKFNKRLDLMNVFDQGFQKKFKTDEVQAYTQFYEETLKLMDSEDLDTFIQVFPSKREAEKVKQLCPVCHHDDLVTGVFRSTGLNYFRPKKSG